MGVIPGDTVKISLSDANSSALVEDNANGEALYVVMPMRL
jgi:DNA polymerase-3 subunit beta